ncbi:sensor histidine kinase [Rathayibacter soli]|uniref:sensor histidine kinase n=1 Tax=Rathayibacter soli TaxID=3144168 RepID=UPI0027E46E5C|nr:HAMP domain-containing sensor histidine kinase [Glaciibacter superstes]
MKRSPLGPGRPDNIRRASNRLAIQTGGLLVVLLAAIAAAVFIIVGANQSAAASRLLEDATQHVDSVADAPAGVWLAIDDHGTLSVSPGMPAGLPNREAMERASGPPGDPRQPDATQSDVTVGGVTYIVRTQRSPDRVVQAVFSKQDNDAEMARLAVAFLVAGVGAVLLVSVLAAWLSRRVMRPLSDALAMQKRFVADASHELRTPVTILSTRAQLLKRELNRLPGETTAAQDADALVQDARALTEILEDLLTAVDPREAEAREDVELAHIADDVCRGLAQRATAKGVTITRAGVAHAVVVGSPGALRRVFVALIDNALEFARSSIVVDLRRESGNVVIEVTDDGPGFPAEIRDRAFERFARARLTAQDPGDASAARHYGLGLALVAEIATRHGGTVELSDAATAQTTGAATGLTSGALVRLRLPEAVARP